MLPRASLIIARSFTSQSKKLFSGSVKNPISVIGIRFASTTRRFTEKHEWISITGDKQVGRVGISNHAQDSLGDVVYVQVPEIGVKCNQFDEVGAIESVKAASELLCPVSGEIVGINEKLEHKPALVNTDCYGKGWLFEIKMDDSKELDKLMTEEQYNQYLKDTTPQGEI